MDLDHILRTPIVFRGIQGEFLTEAGRNSANWRIFNGAKSMQDAAEAAQLVAAIREEFEDSAVCVFVDRDQYKVESSEMHYEPRGGIVRPPLLGVVCIGTEAENFGDMNNPKVRDLVEELEALDLSELGDWNE